MSHVHASCRGGFPGRLAVLCLVALGVAVVLGHAVTASDAAAPDRQPVRPAAASGSPSVDAAPAGNEHVAVAPGRRLAPHTAPGPTGAIQPAERWHQVLERLSRIRALAWRRGQPALLRRVYSASAAELRLDQAMLRRYVARELSVRGADLAFGPVRVASRGSGVVRLRVVDQLRAAVAVNSRGTRRALPRDSPTRHLIELRKTGGRWRIASVTDTAP